MAARKLAENEYSVSRPDSSTAAPGWWGARGVFSGEPQVRPVIIFLSGPSSRDPRALERLTGKLQVLGREVADLSVSVGVSRFTSDLSGLRKGFEEALAALKVGRKLQGLGSVTHFDSVGSYKLLLSIWEHDPEELRTLYQETIDPSTAMTGRATASSCSPSQVPGQRREPLQDGARPLCPPAHHPLPAAKDRRPHGLSVFKSEDKERLSLGLKARGLLRS